MDDRVKVLVISDTHGNIEGALEALKKEPGISEIWHLGDHASDAKRISDRTGIPFIAVKGNCDGSGGGYAELLFNSVNEVCKLKNGKALDKIDKFLLIHCGFLQLRFFCLKAGCAAAGKLFSRSGGLGAFAAILLGELVERDGETLDWAHHAAEHTGDENFAGRQIGERFDALDIGDRAVHKAALEGALLDLLDEVPEDLCGSNGVFIAECESGRSLEHLKDAFVDLELAVKVRKEASDASIIVVNHHLLFADIESRMNGGGYEDTAVLPPYKRIVFDEAHGIEDSATSFFSESITRFKLMKQVNLLYRQKRAGIAGFAVATAPLSNSDSLLDKIPSCVNEIKENFLNLELFTQEAMGNEYSVRIFAATAPRFDRVFAAMQKLKDSIGGLTGTVRELIDGIDEDDRDVPSVWECKTVLRRLDSFVTLCKNFCEWNEHDDSVSWIQLVRLPPKKSGDEPLVFPQFTQTPLDIAHMMNSGVFEPMSSVVCTSATLRTGDNFSYWMRRTGLSFVEDERLLSGAFESPFPYKTNAIFAVPSDAPFPDSPYYQGYVEETLPKLIFAAGGRTLVLFTSYESLRSAFYNCRQTLEGGGISLLKQGDDDRFRLLERFKEDKSSVLFATDSFWEGVDVPGESLSQVVIVKLPFAVPNDPVFAARAEAVERRGGSPFMELSVPQAVIKFRQGFGRLIRRGDDKGVIVVLDRRIVEKRYGKEFTKSVPQTRRMYNPLSFIVNEVEKFFSV